MFFQFYHLVQYACLGVGWIVFIYALFYMFIESNFHAYIIYHIVDFAEWNPHSNPFGVYPFLDGDNP
jgi:hypothetical protein